MIQRLRDAQSINNEIEVDEQDVHYENIASYSQVVPGPGNNGQCNNLDIDGTDKQNNQYKN